METNNELMHYGVLGMKWGIRRFRKKSDAIRKKNRKLLGEENKKQETQEELRARLLKSTNASELYKHRNVLTTAEINERLNRIDTERRLSDVANKGKKTAIDRVDTVLKYGKKINEAYQFLDTSVMKSLKKTLFGKKLEGMSPDMKKIWDMRDSLSDEEFNKYLKRANAEKAFKKMMDEQAKADADEKASEYKDSYNKRVMDGDAPNDSKYRKKGKDVVDRIMIDISARDVPEKDVRNTDAYLLGERRVAGLLESKSRS